MRFLPRKINSFQIPSFEKLTGSAAQAIKVLAREDIAIKGGFAKIILGEVLKSEGKIKKNLALGYKSETDLEFLEK